jgi:hypothetical protein
MNWNMGAQIPVNGFLYAGWFRIELIEALSGNPAYTSHWMKMTADRNAE